MKHPLIAVALAAAATVASAANQSVSFVDGVAEFNATKPVLAGLVDTVTFTGLAPGTYEYALSFSAQFVNLFGASFNNEEVPIFGRVPFSFGSLEGVFTIDAGSAPLTFSLVGRRTNPNRAGYSGELSVAMVPEPETYAMFAAGLAAMGFLLRRRSKV